MSTKRNAVIFGVANERSLAWAIAQNLHRLGYSLAFTYQGERLERRVRPLAESLGAKLIESCDVSDLAQVESFKSKVESEMGSVDVLVHSLAFAKTDELEGRFVDTSREGFRMALEISAYSLVELCRIFEPLLEKAAQTHGAASVLTLSYYGAVKVIPNYNIMGVAKAALEACVRYLATDLGPKKIRVNAISAGPVKTLAAAGIRNFRDILTKGEGENPLKENISAEDVGLTAAYLCGTPMPRVTGTTIYVDAGASSLG